MLCLRVTTLCPTINPLSRFISHQTAAAVPAGTWQLPPKIHLTSTIDNCHPFRTLFTIYLEIFALRILIGVSLLCAGWYITMYIDRATTGIEHRPARSLPPRVMACVQNQLTLREKINYHHLLFRPIEFAGGQSGVSGRNGRLPLPPSVFRCAPAHYYPC